MNAPLVEARSLTKTFETGGGLFRRGRAIRAVSDVDLGVRRGEAVGLIGESGSGKSTIGRLTLGLLERSAGELRFDGEDIAAMSAARRRMLRKRMQLVFQDPYSSLDPRRTVGEQIADSLAIHAIVPPAGRRAKVEEWLAHVGLAPDHADRLPHAFSGGQRQRVGIARALAVEPELLVADEPVSALDVSVQAQVLGLLSKLRDELGLALLFISHDLSAVRHLCDRIVVLYLGRVMEEGPTQEVYANPRHPYTRALLAAAPSLKTAGRKRELLQGDPPSPANPPSGCVFRTRCPLAQARCAEETPRLERVASVTDVRSLDDLDSHRLACWFSDMRTP